MKRTCALLSAFDQGDTATMSRMLTRDAVYVVRMSERGGPDPAQRVEGRNRIVEAFRTLDALLSFEEYANPVTICLAFPAVPGLTVTAVR